MSEETNGVINPTIISKNSIRTHTLNADEINAKALNIGNLGSIAVNCATIKELTVDVLNINDGETSSATENSETTETTHFNTINLNFADDYNCVYMMADHTSLTSNIDGYELNIDFTVPSMGSKVVCRYLVLDLRELDGTLPMMTIWPDFGIKWLYGVPDIQQGYFYVLAFQRFAEDLIIGNVAVKIEGDNV